MIPTVLQVLRAIATPETVITAIVTRAIRATNPGGKTALATLP
jgi:hypothetical protein